MTAAANPGATASQALRLLTDEAFLRIAGQKILIVLAILLGAHVAAVLLQRLLRALLGSRLGRTAKVRTLAHFLGSIAVFIMYFGAIGLALGQLGVSLAAYIASATVIGFALSFGSQSVVQDVISGVTLITSDLLDIGDMVDIGGQIGIVRSIGIRYTQITTFTCSRVYIPNRNVANVVNYELGHARVFLDARLPPGHEQAARERVASIANAAFDQFRGVMIRGPLITEPKPGRDGERFLRVEFRIWPGQGAVVETTVRQSVIAAMKALDPGYADWMAPAHYRVEPCDAPAPQRTIVRPPPPTG